MPKNIREQLKYIPKTPGVYTYYDAKGQMLYVGKAKALHKRVSSYFNKKNLDPKTQELTRRIAKIDYEETDSEIEALMREAVLIKEYRPPFNIKIKDDKDFLYVKMDFTRSVSRPEYIRRPSLKNTKKIKIFGPFTDTKLLRSGMMALRRVFPWCDVSENQLSYHRRRRKPCFDYYIGYCNGFCAGLVNENHYQKTMQQLAAFLAGGKRKVMRDMERDMHALSRERKFEQAARIRDRLRALEHIGDVVESRIKNQGSRSTGREKDEAVTVARIVQEARKTLGYDIAYKKKFRIEFYDMSNTQGTEAVGSMVVWQDGQLARGQYRKFKIRSKKRIDDTAMMREVLTRRIGKFKIQNSKLKILEPLRGNIYWRMPDLIILDGGKPQLGVVGRLFQHSKIAIPLISLAKENEEVWGIANFKSQIVDLHFARLNITKNSAEGYFLQRLRDEAHRFGITYHRVVREKRTIHSRLDDIPGIGPKTRKKLLLHFGSVAGILKAERSEVEGVVGKKLAEKIGEQL